MLGQDILKDAEIKDSKRDTKSYYLISLDGKKEKLTVIPDYYHHVLKITSLKDTLTVSDYWGVPTANRLLNKNFIRIDYEVRGGSNLGLGNLLILCVDKGKIYEALHVLRYSNWDSGELEKKYNVNINLASESAFRLIATVRDKSKSIPKPNENYSYNIQSILNFDKTQHSFYSIKMNVYGATAKPFDGKTTKKINGNFPVIFLGQETYYHMLDRWYKSTPNSIYYEFD